MMALAADVQTIQQVMSELEVFENVLRNEDESHVSSKSIEVKASIKKLMTDSQVLESLNRLELEGQPVWGLSTEEREMIMLARETVNDC
jgi:glutamine amidotransferase PdxT